MILEKDRKNLFILDIISMVLCLAVCVPFGLKRITLFEIIFKYVGIAVIILFLTLTGMSLKYRSYKPTLKYSIVATYFPLFAYIFAVVFSGLLMMIRFPGSFSTNQLICYILLFALICVLFIAFTHIYPKRVCVFSKNEAMLIDAFLVIIGIIFTICVAVLGNSLRGDVHTSSVFLIILPIIAGVGVGILHGYNLKYLLETNEELKYHKSEDLVTTWLEQAESLYGDAKEEILWEMYDYLNQALGIEVIDIDDENEEPRETVVKEVASGVSEETVQKLLDRIAELESEVKKAKHIIESSKDSIIAKVNESAENDKDLIVKSLEDSLNVISNERKVLSENKAKFEADCNASIASLQEKLDKHAAEEAEKARLEQEALEAARIEKEQAEAEKARREQERLEREAQIKIIPSCEECVEWAKTLGQDREDIELTVNDKQNNFKFTAHGKMFLQIISAVADYKVSFLGTADQMRDLLYEHLGVVTFEKNIEFAQSKGVIHQLKAVYKGDESLSYEALQDMMKNSLQVLLDAEEAEEKAIEAEKARIERAKEAEKLLREKEKQEEKEQKRLEAEALKQAQAEEKAKEASNEEAKEPAKEEAQEESEKAE